MYFNNPETIIKLTPNWKGERLSDGRPKVSDDIINRIRKLNFEEIWVPLDEEAGYHFQYECNFKAAHPTRTFAGRAVTAVMVPQRPDLNQTLLEIGYEQGYDGFFNQWVVDNVVDGDVVVVDLYDQIYKGTYVGGNLMTAISKKTKTGGAVIWGGIRDLEQIIKIDNDYINVFYRGLDPTGIGDCSMVGLNTPCRIGRAICMPGDVVVGTMSGVIFIPPHMAEHVAIRAEKLRVKDVFGFERLAEGKYTTADIDRKWLKPMWADFIDWFSSSPEAKPFAHLNFDDDIQAAEEA